MALSFWIIDARFAHKVVLTLPNPLQPLGQLCFFFFRNYILYSKNNEIFFLKIILEKIAR
ncbi:MAG: hypothetical protein COA47_06865 [Robiginitomaculum sp.]|nr:MAG: hypothetical protein COA47_06865 [Robiginitomaculum sp.]